MTLALNRSPQRLDRLVEECLSESSAELSALPAPLTRQIGPGIPEYPIDRALMKEAVVSLLREAIARAGAAAQLRVTVKANRNAIMFAVKAPGPGLSAEKRESLFVGDPRPGSMSRARAIITAHGGVTWANGLPGKGITYYFSLPIRHAAPSRP